jgi:signal transduction histidine kinase
VWRTGAATRTDNLEVDVRNTGRAAERAAGRTRFSAVVAPIREDGIVIGTITALSYRPEKRLGDHDKASIESLSAQASVALKNARMFTRLTAANEELREAQAIRDEFVANISHEFRTPLTVISGAAEMLEDQLSESDRNELVRRIRSNSRRLEGMVADVLLAARIDGGRAEPHPRVVDLRSRISTIIEDLGAIGDGVSNEVLPGMSVIADPDHVDRMIVNLLSNAFKYGQPPVVVQARSRAGGIEIVVRDHGAGIAPDVLERLFARFAQGDSGNTRRSMGVGLGLHIVDELARLNRGSVRHEHAQPGAAFVISLPASQPLRATA